MKAILRDVEMFRSLRPLDLTSYLRSTGWRLTEESNKAAYWEKTTEAGTRFEVLVPRNSDLADFASRIGDALQTLEIVENRSQLEIFRDLATASADVIRVRTHARDAEESGSLTLEDGVILHERLREMILAAACATIRRSPVFAKRKPERAMSYLRRIRLGQTERGSYVFTLISPVSPSLSTISDDEPLIITNVEPYERRVVETLANALTATRLAAERSTTSGNMEPFRDAIAQGGSANLFEAMAGMSENSGDQDLQIDFTWARSRRPTTQVPNRIGIAHDIIPIIREAASVFRAMTPYEDFELQGAVVELKREEGEPTGRIVVVGNVEDRIRRVTITLPADQYHEAIRAHEEDIPIICYGELIREGRSLVLRNPHGFALVIGSEGTT